MKRFIAVILVTGLIFGSAIGICSAEDQPRMRAALEHLREAREQLERAAPDKGGHREKAIELVNHAMEQVQKGIEFGERHERRY